MIVGVPRIITPLTLRHIHTHNRAQRSLSFADELGRELHEVHMSHNTQYSNRDRRTQPVDCCVVS